VKLCIFSRELGWSLQIGKWCGQIEYKGGKKNVDSVLLLGLAA